MIRIERKTEDKITIPFKEFRRRLGIGQGMLRIEILDKGNSIVGDPWQWSEERQRSVVVLHSTHHETKTRRLR